MYSTIKRSIVHSPRGDVYIYELIEKSTDKVLMTSTIQQDVINKQYAFERESEDNLKLHRKLKNKLFLIAFVYLAGMGCLIKVIRLFV